MAREMDLFAASPRRGDSADASSPEPPEPRLVERVIHGQRVRVKVYPPMSDPRWADWIRHTVRSPLELSERILD
jgi:hypothetical protein